LYNIALSNSIPTLLGKGLHIPLAVSDREGGRKSLLNLKVGEETQTGTFLIDARVFHQYMARLDGSETPATKANYKEKVTTADGQTVYEQTYQLTQIDQERSIVHLRPYAKGLEASDHDLIVYQDGICYICIGSVWWCGLPCVPIPRGPDDNGPIEHA
jgi:hypothetical protein